MRVGRQADRRGSQTSQRGARRNRIGIEIGTARARLAGREGKESKTDAGSSTGSVGCEFGLPRVMLDFGMFEAVFIILMVSRAVMIEE